MISSEMKNAKSNSRENVKAFVRKNDAPLLPAPPSEVGLKGWLYQNVFHSMSDFSSLGASTKSILSAIFTVFVFYYFALQIYGFVDFAIISAVWVDPDELKRQVCWTVDQGGDLPSGWHGACWPYITAKLKFIMYGAYPVSELWRVNLTYFLGGTMLAWVLIDPFSYS